MKHYTWIFLVGWLAASPALAKNLIPVLAQQGIPKWNPPRVQKEKFPNGFRLYTLADHTLPLFQATLFIETGQAYVSPKKSALADLLADALVTGGTKAKRPKDLDEWLEGRAIRLWADAGRELTTVTASALSSQWEEALGILAEVCLEPRWDGERFGLARLRFLENLRREADQPNSVLGKAFRRALYGKKHPWGHMATPKTVRRVKRRDLVEFYEKYFHPNRMLLAVAGDISSARIQKWAEGYFQGLTKQEVADPGWAVQPFKNRARTKKIKKPVNQVFLEAGHWGIVRHQPEKYAYHLLQYILGGDVFTSRLGKDIRTRRGLAYSVYSDWEATPARGHFKIHVETKAESAPEVRQAILDHLQRIRQKADLTPAELASAREALLNQYIFWFDSPFEMVNTQAKLDLTGFPPDYLQTYPQKMRGVTLEEIKAVAKQYLEPDQLTWVTVAP